MRAGLWVLLLACAPLSAQPLPGLAGQDPFGPMQKREMGSKVEAAHRSAPPAIPFAVALSSAFPSAEWAALKVSSPTPAQALSGYLRAGYYRQELVVLALIGLKAGRPLPQLAKRRDNAESLRSIAESLKLDYLDLLAQADALKQKLDQQAVPLEEIESSSRAARAKAAREKSGLKAEEEYDEP